MDTECGLMTPPRVVPTQVVIVQWALPLALVRRSKTKPCEPLRQFEGSEYSPGWKFNHWELKGVLVRLEMVPKMLKGGFVSTARRDTGEKGRMPIYNAATEISVLLETIQSDMYTSVLEGFRNTVKIVKDWALFTPAIDKKHLCLIPFCLQEECEDRIKKLSERAADGQPQEQEDTRAPSMGAKSLCIPFKQPTELKGSSTNHDA